MASNVLESYAVLSSEDTYKVRSAKTRKCDNRQRIICDMESAKWRCKNMYKMRKCEKGFNLSFIFDSTAEMTQYLQKNVK